MRMTWQQALAWRMRRQLLEPVGAGTVAGVVGRRTVKAELLEVAWFPEADAIDRDGLTGEVARLGAFLGRSLDLTEGGS